MFGKSRCGGPRKERDTCHQLRGISYEKTGWRITTHNMYFPDNLPGCIVVVLPTSFCFGGEIVRMMLIDEIRKLVYERDSYLCQYPGCDKFGYGNIEMAHRMSNSEMNIGFIRRIAQAYYGLDLSKKDARAMLNHPLNLITSCSYHNQLFLIDNRPAEKILMVERILGEITRLGIDEREH